MRPYLLTPSLFTETAIPEKGILSHTLYNDDALKIILFGFASGQELTAHTAPMPATMMFLEGEANITVGDDKHSVGSGALVHMEPKVTHSIVAATPLRMLLYLHKAARQG
ncbi:MAG TPA: cupin domain-containing protein [Bryobacteraceae bacterium]|nr:cupin domain-containing protein [Bryobacteraceae bacterium]